MSHSFFALLVIIFTCIPHDAEACYMNKESGKFCSHAGYCEQMVCKCWNGFEGPACEKRKCPMGKAWGDSAIGVDDAHNLAVCSNRGHCNTETGSCECLPGYEGDSCNRLSCPGTPVCNGHGRCLSQQRMSQEIFDMKYNFWDADMIYGCVCDDLWEGYDCSLRTCPTGDDVMTTEQVNEIQYIKCDTQNSVFQKTHFYIGFRRHWTRAIHYDDSETDVTRKLEELPSIEKVLVTFQNQSVSASKRVVDPNQGEINVPMACADDKNGDSNKEAQIIAIQFLRQFGDLPPLIVSSPTPHGPTVSVACKTENIWFQCPNEKFVLTSSDGSTNYVPIMGTKEESTCAGRGSCDTSSGNCTCYYPFQSSDGDGPRIPKADSPRTPNEGIRGECGFKSPNGAVYTCPGEIPCMGHGVCSYAPRYECQCNTGYTGPACNLRTCPYGKAWFGAPEDDHNSHALMECSNRGICERDSGLCFCQSMFSGNACDNMKCPVSLEQEDLGMCSGHGDCIFMHEMAKIALDNGDATDYSYGDKPSDESTWDFDQVKVCSCDPGFTGIDCSKRKCPTTDDKNTPGFNEVQEIKCGVVYVSSPQENLGCFDIALNKRLGFYGHLNNQGDDTFGITLTEQTLNFALNACLEKGAECIGVLKSRETDSEGNLLDRKDDGSWSYVYDLRKTGSGVEPTLYDQPLETSYVRAACEYSLSFRQKETRKFDVTTSLDEVQAELNKLTTIHGGLVITNYGDPNEGLCPLNKSGDSKINTWRIEFKKTHGDLPKVKFLGNDYGFIGSDDYTTNNPFLPATVEEIVKGTKENAECGNHGLCNYNTGMCECYDGYAASDGDGGKGPIEDCGYKTPFTSGGGDDDDE